MTYLAPIDRAAAEPVLTLITDHDRAAEGRAMAEDIDTVLSRAPIRSFYDDEGATFWETMAFAVCAGLASVVLALVLPLVW